MDNRTTGLVIGRLTFAAIGSVDVCLKGDFKSDILGQVIALCNSQFSDDAIAGHRLSDFAIPQLGTVSLISFDPHPLLDPHPYFEWFSLDQDHYRIELAEGDAWIVEPGNTGEFDEISDRLRDTLVSKLEASPTESKTSDQEWF
ncbi:hypothetical protein [Candidatus Nitronereus thalassa]|uniref:Uncharacterized protein n=1 Tax=Candidatus Nitronereus thalassa TaxID=3020898 RepID=A0ABU3K543_9BACT|nr:hypothetical protein [Candidatus Nitronereus thalassa]MDT7041482.1 hypothetical protein [Candidatus Nitronereus thalassa]